MSAPSILPACEKSKVRGWRACVQQRVMHARVRGRAEQGEAKTSRG
jgi:hypothetical protein